jgi:hypothetical protein
MQCKRKKSNGERCRARALVGKQFCALHADKNRAAELGSRGGRRRAVYPIDDLQDMQPPQNAADLKKLLGDLIARTMAGKTDPRVANTVAYTGASFLRAVELSDLEARLATLEAAAKAKEALSEKS